jgi:TolA-binding protein
VLCGTFAAALALYQSGQLAEAARGFGAILAEHPSDGPSRFFLGRCDAAHAAARGGASNSAIVVETP